ncbi:MAG TPA: hypothetical protein PLY70_12070 [Saprospiraceae bacterium]|nr:hypothetical protein [Saprospiraceae bacterium]
MMETKDTTLPNQIKNQDALFNNLLTTLIDHFLKGINTCVVSSVESKAAIASLLGDHGFKIISNSTILKKEELASNFLSLALERYDTLMLIEKFQRYLKALNDQKVNGVSFVKLLRSKTYTLPFPLSFSITNQFTFLPNEFSKIKEAIETGVSLYSEEFDSISKNGLKNLKFKEASEIEDVLSEYRSDLDRLKDLHARYSRAFNSEKVLSLEKIKSSESTIRKVKEDLEKLLFVYKLTYGEKDAPKPGLLSLSKHAKESYESWKSLIDQADTIIKSTSINDSETSLQIQIAKIADIESAIIQLDGQLSNWWKMHQRQTDDRIKRINHINLHAHVFTDLYAELNDILRTMTSKSIYAKDLECNARSSIKQLEYLDETILNLSSEMSDLLRIPLYFKWKNFLEQQDHLTNQIFKDLTVIPKAEWVNCFTTNYINTYCEQQIHSIPLFVEEDANLLKSKFTSFLENLKPLLNCFYEKELARVSEVLSLVDKKLSKQTETGLPMKDASMHLNELNFPIVLVDVNEVNLIETCKKSGFAIYHTDTELLNESLYIQKPNAKLSETPVTEQITIAKALSKGLLSITRNIKIYQLQFANIICADDGYIPSLLIEEFKKYGIKEFSMGNYGEDHLIESIIMTDRPQYMILRDGLVDAGNDKNIGQQLNTVHAFEVAGYKAINIWTSKMKEDAFKIRSYLSTQLLPSK